MRDVILDSAAEVEYDGHLFVLNPTSRTAAKRSPGGRVPPFSGRMNGPAYVTSRGLANPTTRPTTLRRDPASASLPATQRQSGRRSAKQKAALDGRPGSYLSTRTTRYFSRFEPNHSQLSWPPTTWALPRLRTGKARSGSFGSCTTSPVSNLSEQESVHPDRSTDKRTPGAVRSNFPESAGGQEDGDIAESNPTLTRRAPIVSSLDLQNTSCSACIFSNSRQAVSKEAMISSTASYSLRPASRIAAARDARSVCVVPAKSPIESGFTV